MQFFQKKTPYNTMRSHLASFQKGFTKWFNPLYWTNFYILCEVSVASISQSSFYFPGQMLLFLRSDILLRVAAISQVRCGFSRKRRHIMSREAILLLFKKDLLNGSFPSIKLTSTYNVKWVFAKELWKKMAFAIFWKGSFHTCLCQDGSISNSLQDICLKWSRKE